MVVPSVTKGAACVIDACHWQLAHMAARKARDEDHAIRRLLREIARTLQVR